jgi:hypothetical protein
MLDIPTSLTRDETCLLQSVSAGRRVYEAGALLGYSTVAIAGVARHVTSVDPHDGYPLDNPRPTWDAFRRNVRRAGVADRVSAVRDRFESVPVPPAVDVAWADMTGERAVTEAFLAHVNRVPVVALHDYARTNCCGATEAVDRWLRATRRTAARVDSLLIAWK